MSTHISLLTDRLVPVRTIGNGVVLALALASALAPRAHAGSSYSEGVNGDLSNVQAAPTSLTFSAGDNEVHGTTGRAGPVPTGVVDRDFLTFTVPGGFELTSVTMLSDTTSAGGGSVSFIAAISGSSFPSLTDPSTLLGYHHYSPSEIGTDILDNIGSLVDDNQPATAQGFSGPLPAGNYAFWIQETAADSHVGYGFNFRISQVPDAGLGFAAMFGVFALTLFTGARRRTA